MADDVEVFANPLDSAAQPSGSEPAPPAGSFEQEPEPEPEAGGGGSGRIKSSLGHVGELRRGLGRGLAGRFKKSKRREATGEDLRVDAANATFRRLFKMLDYNRDHSLR